MRFGDWGAFALALPLLLVPLWIAPGWLLHYDLAPKVVAVAVCAAWSLLWMAYRPPSTLPFAVRTLLILFVMQAAFLLLATALSDSPSISLGGSSWRRFGAIPRCAALLIAASLAVEMAARPGYWKWVLRIASLSGLVAALYAVAQYCGIDPWIDREAYTDYYFRGVRPPATLGHAAYLATFLLQTTFVSIALWTVEDRRAWRIVAVVSAVLGHAAIVLSGTRAALGALVCGWLLLAALRRPRRIRLAAAVACGALAAVFLFSMSGAGEPFRARIRQWASDPTGGPRPMVWRDTLRMASTKPFAGFGVDTFTKEFPLFQSESLAASYPNHYHESPHNIFLDALVEEGIGGVALLAATIGIGLLWGLRGRRPECAPLVAGLAATVLALQFTVFVLPTWLFFLVQLGLLSGIAGVEQNRRQVRAIAGIRVAVAAAAAGFLLFAIGLAWAECGWQRVDRLLASGKAPEAIEAWQDLPRWGLLGASADLWFARRLLGGTQNNTPYRQTMLDEALKAAKQAEFTSDEPADALLVAATLYALRGDTAETEAHLRSACARAPTWYKPRWILSKVQRAQGKLPEAEAEERLAVRLHGGTTPEPPRP